MAVEEAIGAEGRKPAPATGVFTRLWAALRRGETGSAAPAGEIAPDLEAPAELTDDKRGMTRRVIAFDHTRVADVMVPRADIVAVSVETDLQQLLAQFHAAAHSRMPIYKDSLDDPIGMVHIKDVVGLLAAPEAGEPPDRRPILEKIRRDILFAPPSMPVTDLLLKMQTTRIHMALVVDEFGGTDGLVSIEDLVEEIVGEIRDEHDEQQEPALEPRGDGGYDADARVEVPEFVAATGWPLDLPDGVEEDIDTLGGMVFSLAGRVPQRGEVISHPCGVEFEVVDADPRRIKQLRVYRRAGETAAGAPAGD